ncbi:T9SS type A sorting domain-containing protein [bacterium]|nr:T9SS type A sorting domain-containing protein [bacterium]
MKTASAVSLLAFGLVLIISASAVATPYYTPAEIEQLWPQDSQSQVRHYPGQGAPPLIDNLDDYILPVEYVSVLDWLTTMQELNPGQNYGGQHEGETSTWNIIQTDNTAEAIRDWAHYARITGDTTRYRNSIDAAFTYCFNFPAYSEGSTYSYYTAHNNGWALVSVMEYIEAYGHDDQILAYGDSCASHINLYRLSPSNLLNSFAGSFAAGSLYIYGQWRGNQDWMDGAQDYAETFKTYIEDHPTYLGSATWAMSGGTLLWGVTTALFLDDPVGGQAWLPNYIQHLPTYSGGQSWNNSHTVWNGFAWHRVHQIMGDQESLDNALFVMDYLFGEMYLDDDSGIPGTEGTYTDDQSWTTAYFIWYELDQYFDTYDNPYDAAAVEFTSPTPSDVIQINSDVPVSVVVANAGLRALDPTTQEAFLTVTTPEGDLGPYTIDLAFGEQVEFDLPNVWTPTTPGLVTLTATFTTAGDNDTGNDTCTVDIEVRSDLTITGRVFDADDQTGVGARVKAVPLAGPQAEETTTYSDPDTGYYTLYMTPGQYRIEVLPQHVPYVSRMETIIINEDPLTDIDFSLPYSNTLYVFNGPEENLADGYQRMAGLFGASWDPCVWPVQLFGPPEDEILTDPINRIFWSHLMETGPVFSVNQYTSLNIFLDNEAGNLMLVSGHTLMNVLDGDASFRLGVVQSQLDMNKRLVVSNQTHFLQGDSLFLAVRPQFNQVDAVGALLPSATRVGNWAGTNRPAGQVMSWNNGSRSVVLGFPLEVVHPDRGWFADDVLARLMDGDWASDTTEPASDGPESAGAAVETSMSVWPNPFNASTAVTVQLGEAAVVNVTVYDLLGREVAVLARGEHPAGAHRFVFDSSHLASGLYFVRASVPGEFDQTRKVMLVR